MKGEGVLFSGRSFQHFYHLTAGAAVFLALAGSGVRAQDRPGLFFREDWKETPAATPVTQEHVSHPDLLLLTYGPGKEGIKKSHHDKPADDPFYIWTGTCAGNCAIVFPTGR